MAIDRPRRDSRPARRAFFTGQAYRRWPDEFSPLTHYHSDLGMTVGGPPGANTALGAQYYNAGQVFIGLAVILFIGGLYVYYTGIADGTRCSPSASSPGSSSGSH